MKSELDNKTILKAKALMAKHNKNEIYVKKSNGHMYFTKSSALVSVQGDEELLEHLTNGEETNEPDKPEAGKGKTAAKDKKSKGSKNTAVSKPKKEETQEGTAGAGEAEEGTQEAESAEEDSK